MIKKIYCPKCVGRLKPKLINKIEIEVCYICEGIWFEKGELEKILNFEFKITNFLKGMFNFEKIIHLDKRQHELNKKKGKCPVCNKEMLQKKYKGVLIDYCSLDHGIWLDSGELEYIIKKNLRLRYGIFWVVIFLLLLIISRGCILRMFARGSGGSSGGGGAAEDW